MSLKIVVLILSFTVLLFSTQSFASGQACYLTLDDLSRYAAGSENEKQDLLRRVRNRFESEEEALHALETGQMPAESRTNFPPELHFNETHLPDGTLRRTIQTPQGETIVLGRELGSGGEAIVYCLEPNCERIIKIPRNPESVESLRAEIARERELNQAGIPTARIRNAQDPTVNYLIKDMIPGQTLERIIESGHALTPEQIHDLAEISANSITHNVFFDPNCQNFIWNGHHFIMVDNGAPQLAQLRRLQRGRPLNITAQGVVPNFLRDIWGGMTEEAQAYKRAVFDELTRIGQGSNPTLAAEANVARQESVFPSSWRSALVQ